MTMIVSSLASIVHTLGLLQGDRVHTQGSYDMVAAMIKAQGEHPYSFRLGSASGSDGDIPGRIFSYCSGGIVLVVFPVFSVPEVKDTWPDRTSSFCLTCGPKHGRPNGTQCRARCFYVAQDVRTISRTWNGKTTERSETVLQVSFPD